MKKTKKVDAEETLFATAKNGSILDEDTKVTAGADASQSLRNVVVFEPKSQSNRDEKSSRPVQDRRASNKSERSAEEPTGGTQNNSLIVRKIKRRSKNTRSEPFLLTKSTRNRS